MRYDIGIAVLITAGIIAAVIALIVWRRSRTAHERSFRHDFDDIGRL